jgi:hypothetical protein
MSLQNMFCTTGTSSISCTFTLDTVGVTGAAGSQRKYTSNLQNKNAQGYLPGYSRTAYSTSIDGSSGITGSREACSNLLMNDIVTLFTTDSYTTGTQYSTIPSAAHDSCIITNIPGEVIQNYQLTNVQITNKYTTEYVGPTSTPSTDSSYTLGPTHALSYLTNSADWGKGAGYGTIEYSSSYIDNNPKSVKQSYTAEGSGIGFLQTFNNCRQALFHNTPGENTFPVNTDNLTPGQIICTSTNTYYINCPYTLSSKINGGLYYTENSNCGFAALFTIKNTNKTVCVYNQGMEDYTTVKNWIDSSSYSYQEPLPQVYFGYICGSITGFSSQPTTGPPNPTSWPTDGSINQCSYFALGVFFDSDPFIGSPSGFTGTLYDITISNWQTYIMTQLGGSTSDYQLISTYLFNQYDTGIYPSNSILAYQLNSKQLNATFYPQATPSTGNWSCQANATMSDLTTGIETTHTTSSSQSGNSVGQANILANVVLFQNLQNIGLVNTKQQNNGTSPFNGTPPFYVTINTTFLTTKT